MAKGLGTLADWAKGDLNLEHFTEPSMVEPCHNLSIEEILRDYRLGIVHSTRKDALYDEGDGVEELEIMDDISDVMLERHPLSWHDPLEVPEKETPDPVDPVHEPPAGAESVPENTTE